ncbi:hypothetical protein A2716_04535 [candidate division WWE3 bacterium RIFCSPHIGHO2_01_FULL_40_23]|uniref:EF-hand domain-containing protein n=1 Tax=candidate division WWE3 bacterium RIFCSPLOWO2_01_FULL_41_18 TaxID=1802625 RepID=A0A1F4VDW5_UNCKA|nr:MAG: hypothetical protein A2716_04535 [candidate division WWE3 bacterium RIFCSPHIGHO2_01_FULL_40_23]OGC55140.1 MAG: hypothetical protein A3A78_04145 [candidate division WWE3 bacterium RIFCSPLOWO2_01_FULL_41_18]
MKKSLISFLLIMSSLAVIALSTRAAFLDTGKVSGATFSVGTADIKLLNDLSLAPDSANLLDEKEGPRFNNLYPGWVSDYPIKLFNNSTFRVGLSSKSDYATADDPGSLREYINVDFYEWDDVDGDGILELGELGEVPLIRKTILKWKSEGVGLGELSAGEEKGYVLRFSSESLPESKMGQNAIYDFEFTVSTDGVGQEGI